MRHILKFAYLIVLILASAAWAQSDAGVITAGTSQSGISILTSSLAAFSGTTAIQSLQLNGNIVSHISPGQSGRVMLEVKPTGESTFETDLRDGKHVISTSTRDDHSGCQKIGPDGSPYNRAIHNCFLSANPFLPLVTLSAHVNDSVVSLPSNQTTSPSIQVALPINNPDPDTSVLLAHLSSVVISFDPATHLPISLSYNEHPENNAKADIPVEVRYSNYQNSSGVMVPHSIRKYVNDGLVYEINVDSVTVNSH